MKVVLSLFNQVLYHNHIYQVIMPNLFAYAQVRLGEQLCSDLCQYNVSRPIGQLRLTNNTHNGSYTKDSHIHFLLNLLDWGTQTQASDKPPYTPKV